jgi:multiple sugar transport system permease protein
MKKKLSLQILIGNIILYIFSLFCAFPFYWALNSSFKTESAMFASKPEWFPVNPILFNYTEVIRKTKLLHWGINSVVVSVVGTLLVCVLACLAGYAIAKIKFKGANIIFVIIIATMMLPKYSMLIPLFQILRTLKWFNSYQGIYIPEVANQLPFGIFLIRQFVVGIPKEIFESAEIDGSGELRTFAQIAVYLIIPAIASLAIFTFVKVWNDYMWQLIAVSKSEMMTLPVGLATLQTDVVKIYGEILAGAMIAAFPLIVVFIVFQKYFVRGISAGSVKG